jgi:hypothetical protein
MNFLIFFISSCCLSVLISCSSVPVKINSAVQSFSTQAYYQDKKTGKNQQLSLEVVAKRNQKLRIDAKVILGLHVATAVITNEKLKVAVHAEKKYFEGPASPRTLQKTLGIPFYPIIFHAMLYRQAFRGSGWSCNVKNGKVQSCLQKPSGMTITWEDQEDAMMVVANSKTFNLQWKIPPAENIEEKASYFEVKIPDSYVKLNL